jgi:hypothetical protein
MNLDVLEFVSEQGVPLRVSYSLMNSTVSSLGETLDQCFFVYLLFFAQVSSQVFAIPEECKNLMV